jgi:NADH:ubiquinone oxidoreductase subunit E
MSTEREQIESIIASYADGRSSLTEILLDIKERTGSVTEEAVRIVSEKLLLSVIDVQGVVAFYPELNGGSNRRSTAGKSRNAFDPWSRHPCKGRRTDSDSN